MDTPSARHVGATVTTRKYIGRLITFSSLNVSLYYMRVELSHYEPQSTTSCHKGGGGHSSRRAELAIPYVSQVK